MTSRGVCVVWLTNCVCCLHLVSSPQLHDLAPEETRAHGAHRVRGSRRLQVGEGQEEVLQAVRLSES